MVKIKKRYTVGSNVDLPDPTTQAPMPVVINDGVTKPEPVGNEGLPPKWIDGTTAKNYCTKITDSSLLNTNEGVLGYFVDKKSGPIKSKVDNSKGHNSHYVHAAYTKLSSLANFSQGHQRQLYVMYNSVRPLTNAQFIELMDKRPQTFPRCANGTGVLEPHFSHQMTEFDDETPADVITSLLYEMQRTLGHKLDELDRLVELLLDDQAIISSAQVSVTDALINLKKLNYPEDLTPTQSVEETLIASQIALDVFARDYCCSNTVMLPTDFNPQYRDKDHYQTKALKRAYDIINSTIITSLTKSLKDHPNLDKIVTDILRDVGIVDIIDDIKNNEADGNNGDTMSTALLAQLGTEVREKLENLMVLLGGPMNKLALITILALLLKLTQSDFQRMHSYRVLKNHLHAQHGVSATHTHLEHTIYPENNDALGHEFRPEYLSQLGHRLGVKYATPKQLVDIEFLQALIQAIELTDDADKDPTPDTYPILQRLSNDLFSGTSYIVLDDSAVCCSMINSDKDGDCYQKQMNQVLISFINTLVYKTEEYADLNFKQGADDGKLPSNDPDMIRETLKATITWMPLYVVGILAQQGQDLLTECLQSMGKGEMVQAYLDAVSEEYTGKVLNIWGDNEDLFTIDHLKQAYIQQKNFVENGNPDAKYADAIAYLPHQQTFTLSPGAYLYNIIASSEIVQHLRNTTKLDSDSGCCNGNRLNLMYVNMCSNGTSNKSLVDITKLNVNKFHDLTIFHGTGPNQNRPILMTSAAKLDLQPTRYQAEAAGIFGSHTSFDHPLGYLNYTMNRMKPEAHPDSDHPELGHPVHYPNIITAKQISLATRLDDKRKVDFANTEEVAPDDLGCGPNQCVTLNVIPRTFNGTMGAIKNLPGTLGLFPEVQQQPPDPLLATRKNTGNDSNENPFSFLPTRYQIPNEFLSTLDEKGNVNYLDDFVIEFMEGAFTPGIFQGGGKRQFNTGQCNSTYDLSSGTLSFSTGSKSCKRVCEKGAKEFGATDGDDGTTKCDGITNCYISLFVHYMHNNDKGKVLKDPGSNDPRPDACQNNCYTYSKFIVGRDNLSQLEGESLVGGWTGLRKDLGTKIRPRNKNDNKFPKEDIANGFASNIYHNICAIKQDASDGGKGAKVKGGIKSAFINVDYQVNDKFILADPVQEDEINPNDPISLGDNFIVAKYNNGYYTDNMSITTPLVGIYDDLSTLSQIRQTTGFSQHSWLNHTDGALGLGFIFMQAFCSGGGGGTLLCKGNSDDQRGSLCDNQKVAKITLPTYPVSDPYVIDDGTKQLLSPKGTEIPDCDLTLEELVESCEVTEEPGIEPTGEPHADLDGDDEESESELDSELDSE